MSHTQYIDGYKSKLDLRQTQQAIKVIKDTFQVLLAQNLHLERVTAPVLVTADSGINDDLSGVERIDRLLWPWALYQTLACRLMGRASLYQRGGAYGFRDQLQDAVNLLSLESAYARERILDACRHQYEEGDVMHWWHEPFTGVRTRSGVKRKSAR